VTKSSFKVVLNEVFEQGSYAESISGNEREKSFTWSSVYLQKWNSLIINQVNYFKKDV